MWFEQTAPDPVLKNRMHMDCAFLSPQSGLQKKQWLSEKGQQHQAQQDAQKKGKGGRLSWLPHTLKMGFDKKPGGNVSDDKHDGAPKTWNIDLGLTLIHRPNDALGHLIGLDRKSTRLNSSHTDISRMPSSA